MIQWMFRPFPFKMPASGAGLTEWQTGGSFHNDNLILFPGIQEQDNHILFHKTSD